MGNTRTVFRRGGMTLVEAIFGVALMSIVFWGIFGVLKVSIELVAGTKAKTGALALAGEQIEFVRSLSYDDVGTVGGIPPGNIPQIETIQLNETTYTRRTLVQYVDDPEDGTGINDETGITADYKKVKVELTWTIRGVGRALSLVTTIVPKGIESVTGGGTLWVNVLDAYALPLQGADVRVVNDTISPSVDVTTFSNNDGVVIFPGAPQGSGYEITVSKADYSTAQTYDATVGNPNPTPAHLSVVEGETTSSTFAIDRLAENTVRTFEPMREELYSEIFDDASGISDSASTTLSAGLVTLALSGGVYESEGYIISETITPGYLSAWQSFSWEETKPLGTSVRYHVLYESSPGVFLRLPEAILPGNGVGFEVSPVNLSGIDAATYSSLRLEAELATTDTMVTPEISAWSVSSVVGPIPILDVAFVLRGTKTIGSDASAAPIYKYEVNHVTDSTGEVIIDDLEWDTYTLTENDPSLVLIQACPTIPFTLDPGVAEITDLYLAPSGTHTVLVRVVDDELSPVSGATVTLARSGFEEAGLTERCGQKSFADLSSANDYDISVSASGFDLETQTNVTIVGNTEVTIMLNPN